MSTTTESISFANNPLYKSGAVGIDSSPPNVAGVYSGSLFVSYSDDFFSGTYSTPPSVSGTVTFMGVTYDSSQGDEFDIVGSRAVINGYLRDVVTLTITGINTTTANPDGSVNVNYPKGSVTITYVDSYSLGYNNPLYFDTVDVNGPGSKFISSDGQVSDTRLQYLSSYTEYDNGIPKTVNYAPVTSVDTYVPCYVSETLIRTSVGNLPVESLSAGALAITASGKHRRIVWLGHRTIDCKSHASPETVWPYRIRAHAFGENLPARDLFLSPDHAVMVPLLSEVLIPIKHLDNGATITQVPVDEVTYWHVELESHDLLLAENLPAESFLDTLGRDFFERQGFEQDKASFTTKAGRPHLKNWQTDACRPLVTEGAIVAAAREMLLARAQELGWTKTQEADLHVLADGARIEGLRLSETTIRFTFPASTQDLQLASRSFVPRQGDVATLDERRLGVPVASLVLRQRRRLADLAALLSQGTGGGTTIALDGPGLITGFHPAQEWEGWRWRWTNGAARLSAALWAGLTGTLTLDVELASERGIVQVWQAPADVPLKRAA